MKKCKYKWKNANIKKMCKFNRTNANITRQFANLTGKP